jgi:hypothetical protein
MTWNCASETVKVDPRPTQPVVGGRDETSKVRHYPNQEAVLAASRHVQATGRRQRRYVGRPGFHTRSHPRVDSEAA